MLEYIATVDINFGTHSVALFDSNEKFITKVDFKGINDLAKSYKLDTTNTFGIANTVTDSNLVDIPFKYQLARRLLLHGKFLDMPVQYSEKIQDDRLVNSYFLFKQNDSKKLILNCSHIMTADFVDQSGFQGGFILPSIHQLRSLFKYDEYFKHFMKDDSMTMAYGGELPQENLAGIEQGTLAAFYFQIKGILKEYRPESVFITGPLGDDVARFLKPTAEKENISIQLSKELTHRSLCYIAKRVHRE